MSGSNHTIPKIFHISWKTKDFLESQNPLILNGMKQLKDCNQTWDFQISDDADVNKYLYDHLSSQDWALLKDKHIVEKVDVWRLLKMVREGGCYCDIDRYSNIILQTILKPETQICLPIHRSIDFSQDFMCGVRGHKVFARALQLNLERRKAGITDIMSLGPITYYHSVCEWLIGKQLERGQGVDILRHIAQNHPSVETYDETSDTNTFLYREGYQSPWLPGNGATKDDFYAESKVLHWTVENPRDYQNLPFGS